MFFARKTSFGRYLFVIKHFLTMAKALIRLTEEDLHRIVKESVNRILREEYYRTRNLDDPSEYYDDEGNFRNTPYSYDAMFDNAKSLEDFDKLKAKRDKYLRSKAEHLHASHPGTTPFAKRGNDASIGGLKYSTTGINPNSTFDTNYGILHKNLR